MAFSLLKNKQWRGQKTAEKRTARLLKALGGEERKKLLMSVAIPIRDEARRRAPYDEERDKGVHLRDAIFAGAGDYPRHADVLVGVNFRKAPHAHLMEFGWSRKPEGSPFLRPAVETFRAASDRRMQKGLAAIGRSASR